MCRFDNEILKNIEENERKLFEMLGSRERLVKQLTALDKKISYEKGLILHILQANNMKKGNIFNRVSVKVAKNTKISEIERVLPAGVNFVSQMMIKVDLDETRGVLENELRLSGTVVDKVIENIKALQEEDYDELVLLGGGV
jgi:hypothetical protein